MNNLLRGETETVSVEIEEKGKIWRIQVAVTPWRDNTGCVELSTDLISYTGDWVLPDDYYDRAYRLAEDKWREDHQ